MNGLVNVIFAVEESRGVLVVKSFLATVNAMEDGELVFVRDA